VACCCLAVPVAPSSPEDAKNVSPLSKPLWKTASYLAIWALAEPPVKFCSAKPKLIENTVPDGYLSIAPEIALNRFGMPCTPSVAAGGTASRTMCACGAIAYAHSMSSDASPAQPSAAHGPECCVPLPLQLV